MRRLIEAIWSENGLNDAAAAESLSRKLLRSEARIKQELKEMGTHSQSVERIKLWVYKCMCYELLDSLYYIRYTCTCWFSDFVKSDNFCLLIMYLLPILRYWL